jgi:hypothetical protein
VTDLLALPRIAIRLSGAIVAALAKCFRRAPSIPPWRVEIEQLERKLQARCSASDAAIADLRIAAHVTEQAQKSRDSSFDRRLEQLEKAPSWADAIAKLETRLMARLGTQESRTASRLIEQNVRLTRLEQSTPWADAIKDLESRLVARLDENQRRLETTSGFAAAMDKTVSETMLQLEKRMQSLALSLENLSAVSVRSPDRSEPLVVSPVRIGQLDSVLDEDAALAHIFHVEL